MLGRAQSIAAVQRRFALFHRAMQRGQSSGDIQVFVQGSHEIRGQFYRSQLGLTSLIRIRIPEGIHPGIGREAGSRCSTDTTSRLHETRELFPQGRGLLQGFLGELQIGAIVRRHHRQAHYRRGPVSQQAPHPHHIAHRLGHLFAFQSQPGIVHPVARETPTGPVGLGLFVFVVRETQVQATAVDVEFVP